MEREKGKFWRACSGPEEMPRVGIDFPAAAAALCRMQGKDKYNRDRDNRTAQVYRRGAGAESGTKCSRYERAATERKAMPEDCERSAHDAQQAERAPIGKSAGMAWSGIANLR
jgi:hypothetical protein